MIATLAMFVVMIGLIVVGFDIAMAMVAAALVYMAATWFSEGRDLTVALPQLMADGVNSELLFAVPLFVLMGTLMHVSGITEALMRALLQALCRLRGPLGYVNVLANVIISGMSGSAIADAAATSTILVRPMIRTGYSASEAGALTAAAATIGPVIPPSIPFVLIGGLAGVSIGQLFVAGVMPGLLMAAMILLRVVVKARHLPLVKADDVFPSHGSPANNALRLAFAVAIPVVVLGSILSGKATVTESAAFGCALAGFGVVTVFRLRDPAELFAAFRDSATTVGAILITVGTSAAIGWIMAREGFGTAIGQYLVSLAGTPVLMWFVTVTVLLVLGLAFEPIPLILILTPIIFPQLGKIGVSPVHFGVVMTVTLMIGLISPPVGLNLFTVSRAANLPLKPLMEASWPYVGLLAVAAYVLALFPGLSLWLPSLFF